MTARKPLYVSVPELARDLGLSVGRLYYYLERLKVKTESLGENRNSVRFVRRAEVVDISTAIQAYRTRPPVPTGLTAAQVAETLGISPATVRVLVSKGSLKARHVGKRLSFTEAEVARYGRGRRRREVA